MPELPEVETIRRGLALRLRGRRIARVRVADPTVVTGHQKSNRRRRASLPAFRSLPAGRRITALERRGKYLAIELDSGGALVIHLRMTGRLCLAEPRGRERFVLELDDGKALCFSDPRRFGEAFFSRDWKREKPIASLGVEPLNGALTGDYLHRRFRGRKASVHALLLNQAIAAGIGNIYAAEALFRAGILPTRRAGDLSAKELDVLAESIRAVLLQSIRHRGYSLSDYVDALGRKGRSQLFASVYGRQGLPCPGCKEPLARRVIAGRGVVYCPRCQA